jgi:serine/threonine protein kinase
LSPCLPRDELRRFLDDQLDGPSSETVAEHVERCPNCRRLLDELTSGALAVILPARGDDPPAGDDRLIERLKGLGPRRIAPGDACQAAGSAGLSGDVHPVVADSRRSSDGTFQVTLPLARYPAIAGFRILREVGRGGMGVVYEAEEERLSRRVALKVLPASAVLRPRQVERFEREAKAAGRLHHTNIVPVFGSGQAAGHQYYFMQYIEGRSIDAVVRQLARLRGAHQSVPPTEPLATITKGDRMAERSLATIGLQVALALALAHAHAHGVLHRDIKPSNLLLDASGTVWVTDFGLAKTLDADELTSTGDVLGTLRYMAPERFARRCDARSDLYSLGLALYELAALRPAYDAADRYALLESMRRDDPPPLQTLAPWLPRDLETIIHKLIAREPARRYGTAAALAADLQRFLEDRPIEARPASIGERAIRWCRRNPWAASFIVALALGSIGSTTQAIRATASEHAARLAREQTGRERDRAERSRDRAIASINDLLLGHRGELAELTEETRAYRKALIDSGIRESQELVRDLENDGMARHVLIQAYQTLARNRDEAGDLVAAMATIQKAIDLAQALFDLDHSLEAGHDLAACLQYKGAMAADRKISLPALNRSTAIFQSLLAEHPAGDREVWLHGIGRN